MTTKILDNVIQFGIIGILFSALGYLVHHILTKKESEYRLLAEQTTTLITRDALKNARLDAAWSSIDELKRTQKDFRAFQDKCLTELGEIKAEIKNLKK